MKELLQKVLFVAALAGLAFYQLPPRWDLHALVALGAAALGGLIVLGVRAGTALVGVRDLMEYREGLDAVHAELVQEAERIARLAADEVSRVMEQRARFIYLRDLSALAGRDEEARVIAGLVRSCDEHLALLCGVPFIAPEPGGRPS